MINPVGTVSPQKSNKTSIFYINDYHGKAINMERTMTASNAFDCFIPSNPTDKLKLSSGDIMLGEDLKTNSIAVKFLNFIGVTASAMGNHEYDMPKDIAKLIPDMKFKMLSANINIKPENPLQKKVTAAAIEESNGSKYGIIGISPTDLFARLKYGHIFKELQIDHIDETIKDVQNEVDKLKEKGINRIILLSHVGYTYDKKIAKETEGIDIILGGHSHDLLESVKENVNLFNSKNGEPVVITQAGRDGKNFGILNIEWDNENKGIIKKVQNNVATTRNFRRNAIAKYIFETILGKPEVIGTIRTAPKPLTQDLIQASPLACFAQDAIKAKTGADIAIVCSANLRGYLEPGKVDTRVISELSPFKNKITTVDYSEKEIVDAVKFAAKSFVTRNNKPGILQVSGLKYTVSKSGIVHKMSFVDKDGKETPIDINNPRTDKFYKTAINDYYAAGNDNFTMLNKISQAKVFDYDLNACVEEYIRNHKQPIDIVDDGRITIID